MKPSLRILLLFFVFFSFLQPISAQSIILDLTNRKVSADGLQWTFDLMGKGGEGYGGAANGEWVAFNVSIDLSLPAGVNILGGSGIGSADYASASIGVQNNIFGAPLVTGGKELGLTLERSVNDDDLNTASFVLLAQYTINFSAPVSPDNPAFPRPLPILAQSSWVNASDEEALRPFEFVQDSYTLPVKLVNFNANTEGSIAQLSWATTEESNSDRFDVQRSKDGKNWATFQTVKALGESVIEHSYSAIDENPFSGENLYRLHMIDMDGTSAYSSVRNLNFEVQPTSFFPNPVSDMLKIKTPDPSKVSGVSILNSSGVNVYQSASKIDDTIDVSKFKSGVYIVKLAFKNGEESSYKILVVR